MKIYESAVVILSQPTTILLSGRNFRVDETVINQLDEDGLRHYEASINSQLIFINPIQTITLSKAKPSVEIRAVSPGKYGFIWKADELAELDLRVIST